MEPEGLHPISPEVQAEMMHVLGVVYHQLGEMEQAQPLLERSLVLRRAHYGRRHAAVAGSMYDLAWLLAEQGEMDEAMPLMREALVRCHRASPPIPSDATCVTVLRGLPGPSQPVPARGATLDSSVA